MGGAYLIAYGAATVVALWSFLSLVSKQTQNSET